MTLSVVDSRISGGTHDCPIVALQIDPLESLNPKTDTSLMLGAEAIARDMLLFAYTPCDLTYGGSSIYATGRFFKTDINGVVIEVGDRVRFPLEEASYVLVRQNPPYDMGYITCLDILSNLPITTRVLNDAKTLRSWSEKSIPLMFKDLCPLTCITRNPKEIYAFLAAEKVAILKPLYGFGGQDVFILKQNDANVDVIIDMMRNRYPYGVIVQEFISDVAFNDRRLLMIDGKLKAVFKRIPQEGMVRSNMAVGGTPMACIISEADRIIESWLSPFLSAHGIMLAGIDVIGSYLNEVNITSPTGLRFAQHLYGCDLAKDFWDVVLSS